METFEHTVSFTFYYETPNEKPDNGELLDAFLEKLEIYKDNGMLKRLPLVIVETETQGE